MNLREALATQKMRPYQIRIVVICIILAVMDGFEVLVGAFTASGIAKAFDLNATQTGTFLSASTFGMAVGAILISPFADRIGRRKHIIMCLVIIAIGMFGSAIAPTFPVLLAVRAFAGLGIGALIPSMNILVSEYSSDEMRGTVMGIYGVGLPIGSGIGGYISGWLTNNYGWPAAYWFGFVLTAVLLVMAVLVVPESIHYLIEKRPAGALETYNKIAAKLGYPAEDALPEAHAQKGQSVVLSALFQGVMGMRTAYLYVGYALLAAAFYFANQWTPRLVTQFLQTRVPQGSAGAAGWDNPVVADPKVIADLAKSAPDKWNTSTTYVQQMTDAAATQVGTNAGVLVSFGGVAGGLIFAWMARRMHPRVASVYVLCAGLVAYVLYANFYKNATLAMVLALLVGATANGGINVYYAISPPIYPTAARATGVGWMIGFGRAVAILAPIVAGALMDGGMAPATLYQIFGVMMVLSGLCVFLLHRSYRGESEAMNEAVPAAHH
ncbi:MAG: MFS transporter [Dermatophilaceae bacterium]